MADVERLARWVAGATLALYVLGLLSVNGYLLTLGVSDFTLARVRFVYTGTLIVIVTILPCAIPLFVGSSLFVSWEFDPSFHGGRVQSVLSGLLLFIPIGLLLLGGTSAFISFLLALLNNIVSGPPEGAFENMRLAAGLCVSAWFVSGMYVYFVSGIRSIFERRESGRRERAAERLIQVAAAIYGTVTVVGLSILYLSFLMNSIYPKVPVQFGGGRPVEVRVLFKDDAVTGARALGIPFPSDGNLSSAVLLAYEGSDGYVVRLSGGTTIQLNKDMVSGIMSKP